MVKQRDWSKTDAAAEAARGCLVCGMQGKLERAHVIARARDKGKPDALDVVMLCRLCHNAYDSHRLDLYPHLSRAHLGRAVSVDGSVGGALRRIMGARWRDADGALIDERLDEMTAAYNLQAIR